MTSADPSLLGIEHLLPNDHFADGNIGASRFTLEVELHRFLQIGQSLLAVASKAGDVHLEALRDNKLLLPIKDVRNHFHTADARSRPVYGQALSHLARTEARGRSSTSSCE